MTTMRNGPKCKCCDNLVKRNWSSPTKWSTYCSAKCRANDPDFQQTIIDKYGQHPGHTKKAINTRKQTCKDRYGVEFPLQSTMIYQQTQDTCVARHGGQLHGSVTISEKIETSMFDRHGVRYSGQSPMLLEKQFNTNEYRYGVKHPLQNADIFTKMVQTNIDNHGVSAVGQKHIKDVLHLLTDFDWLYDQYITQGKTSTQIAQELNGIYYGTVLNYLKKIDIEVKQYFSFSMSSIQWLNNIMDQYAIYIQHAANEGEFLIPGTKYKVDGYCVATNTVYEFHGDYWHGNLNKYNADGINQHTRCTFNELYSRTMIKEQRIRELGYNLVVKWETE